MESRNACCTIDYRKVKISMDKWRDALKTGTAPDPNVEHTATHTTVPVEAVVRKIDEGIEEASFPRIPGNFVIRADEQAEPVYYGKGTAPQPLDIFLAGIGMCMASIYGEGAADMGITLDSIEIRVRGDLEMEGILDVDGHGYGGRPGFTRISYSVQIESSEPNERIQELIDRVERCCPAHNTVMYGTRGSFNYVLNGKPMGAHDSAAA